MNKLRLDVDALAVESFDVDEETKGRRGTVKGRDQSEECNSFVVCSDVPNCNPSYEAECWWTTNPLLDCLPSGGVTGCPTD